MCTWSSRRTLVGAIAGLCLLVLPTASDAADIYVPAGGDLQAALDRAQSGDTVLLEPGATYRGNFTLPVHQGDTYITLRSAASDEMLPPKGVRISPAYAPYLPTIVSPNTMPALRTRPGAAFWRLMLLEFQGNVAGEGDIIDLGDGSSAQNSLDQIPHHLIVDRVYVHGDPLRGQKRNIGLNSGWTSIVNSYISDAKRVGQDSQAIAGWNGPGPYRIENNYLEGAGNGFLLGGDDPKVPNLTPTDLTFRNNHVAHPLEWRGAIVPTPDGVSASLTLDGALPPGTYAYRIVARRRIGTTVIKSGATVEVIVPAVAGSRITVQWEPVPDAEDYLIYGRTPGAQSGYWRVTTPEWSDYGQAPDAAGTPRSTGTVWQVKNLFELKHVRHAHVDFNIFERNWAQAQTGVAILLTPRNQGGRCGWCVVEDVTFENNVVRSAAGGIQFLGSDDEHQSLVMNHITIRNNVFSDITKSWGGSAYVFYLTRGPRDVTIDHNTIISTGAGVLIADDGPSTGFVFTNNVARHNTYGIFGSNSSVGNASIAAYFPDGVFTRNVMAGGKASIYPSGNLFPSVTDFQNHFVDFTGGNYALMPGTDWDRAGTDGQDLGAIPTARANGLTIVEPPRIETTSLPSGTEFDAYSAPLIATGGVTPMRWSLVDGSPAPGTQFDSMLGVIIGVPSTAGDYPFLVQVTDATGAVARQPLVLHVARAIPPVQVTSGTLLSAVATLPYVQMLQATGGTGTYVWSLSGTLPPGLTFSPSGRIAGTPMIPGATSVIVTATDVADASRSASRVMFVTVAPPPNVPPTVTVSAPADAAVMPVGGTITLVADANDSDGTVSRVDFYVGDVLIGSAAGPRFTTLWLVPTSGTYRFTAVAIDDDGASATSAPVTVTTTSEVVIYASDVVRIVGDYRLSPDALAAGGYGLWNPDRNGTKVYTPLAAPASFAEYTFFAEAGRPYHLWVRGRAQRNDYANDSAHVQFDGVADARTGTATSRSVNLEEGPTAGLSRFGWQDDGYGFGVLGEPIYFEHTGVQTLRIQPREDGLLIDQIILSPERYLLTAPGATKDDGTIVGR